MILVSVEAYSLSDRNAPVKIKASTLDVDYLNNVAEYKSKVLVTQNDLNIKCSNMVIFYSSRNDKVKKVGANTGFFESSTIEKIEFRDNVIVKNGTRLAKGNNGFYDPKTKILVLKGNAWLKDEKGSLEGETVTYNTEKKLFNVVNDKKGIKNGRVRVYITDEKS